MEPVTGSLSVTEDADKMAPVADPQAFFAAAEVLLPGALLLAHARAPGSEPALSLLSGHIVECSLKAVLSKIACISEKQFTDEYKHNLLKLWQDAERAEPAIGPMPEWAKALDKLHNHPFHLRYPMKLHGLVLPNAQDMTSGLSNLIETARRTIA